MSLLRRTPQEECLPGGNVLTKGTMGVFLRTGAEVRQVGTAHVRK